MNKELKIGDEVYIFKYIPSWGPKQDYKNFLKGRVVSSELSDDVSFHGSAQYVMNYTVIDENGNKHYGNYIDPILGDSFFLKKEDYIEHLERKLVKNIVEIGYLEVDNRNIKAILDIIKPKKENQGVVRSRKKNGGK